MRITTKPSGEFLVEIFLASSLKLSTFENAHGSHSTGFEREGTMASHKIMDALKIASFAASVSKRNRTVSSVGHAGPSHGIL